MKGEPLAPAEIEQKLARRFRLLGTQGLVGIALAAIDMALWDALARVHGLRSCGCSAAWRSRSALRRGRVRRRRTGARGRPGEWAERGFKGVKAKIGYPTVREDVAVVRAMRQGRRRRA